MEPRQNNILFEFSSEINKLEDKLYIFLDKFIIGALTQFSINEQKKEADRVKYTDRDKDKLVIGGGKAMMFYLTTTIPQELLNFKYILYYIGFKNLDVIMKEIIQLIQNEINSLNGKKSISIYIIYALLNDIFKWYNSESDFFEIVTGFYQFNNLFEINGDSIYFKLFYKLKVNTTCTRNDENKLVFNNNSKITIILNEDYECLEPNIIYKTGIKICTIYDKSSTQLYLMTNVNKFIRNRDITDADYIKIQVRKKTTQYERRTEITQLNVFNLCNIIFNLFVYGILTIRDYETIEQIDELQPNVLVNYEHNDGMKNHTQYQKLLTLLNDHSKYNVNCNVGSVLYTENINTLTELEFVLDCDTDIFLKTLKQYDLMRRCTYKYNNYVHNYANIFKNLTYIFDNTKRKNVKQLIRLLNQLNIEFVDSSLISNKDVKEDINKIDLLFHLNQTNVEQLVQNARIDYINNSSILNAYLELHQKYGDMQLICQRRDAIINNLLYGFDNFNNYITEEQYTQLPDKFTVYRITPILTKAVNAGNQLFMIDEIIHLDYFWSTAFSRFSAHHSKFCRNDFTPNIFKILISKHENAQNYQFIGDYSATGQKEVVLKVGCKLKVIEITSTYFLIHNKLLMPCRMITCTLINSQYRRITSLIDTTSLPDFIELPMPTQFSTVLLAQKQEPQTSLPSPPSRPPPSQPPPSRPPPPRPPPPRPPPSRPPPSRLPPLLNKKYKISMKSYSDELHSNNNIYNKNNDIYKILGGVHKNYHIPYSLTISGLWLEYALYVQDFKYYFKQYAELRKEIQQNIGNYTNQMENLFQTDEIATKLKTQEKSKHYTNIKGQLFQTDKLATELDPLAPQNYDLQLPIF